MTPDEKLVRLIAVASRDGFSFDSKRYEIGPAGCVDVPSRAVKYNARCRPPAVPAIRNQPQTEP
jgi:hypothetical protein